MARITWHVGVDVQCSQRPLQSNIALTGCFAMHHVLHATIQLPPEVCADTSAHTSAEWSSATIMFLEASSEHTGKPQMFLMSYFLDIRLETEVGEHYVTAALLLPRSLKVHKIVSVYNKSQHTHHD